MPRIRLLYLVWLVVCLAIATMTLHYRQEIQQFYGIAETQETIVSAESAVAVKKIRVVAGQTVSRGTLLAELQDPALKQSINEVSHGIERTREEMAAQANTVQTSLRQLEAKETVNRQLLGTLRNLKPTAGKEPAAPVETPIQAEIEGLRRSLALGAEPLQTKIAMLESQLALLEEKRGSLKVYAQVDGVIGSVLCKESEQLAPFQPIMTLHTASPCYIKGYVHEFAYTKVTTGQTVRVLSLADPAYWVIGEVVGTDSRIVPYPERLKRIPTLAIYGREVQIRIPEKNRLLFGEKVLIRAGGDDAASLAGLFQKSLAYAKSWLVSEAHPAGTGQAFPPARAVTIGHALRDIAPLELSGALYLPDLKKYLVVSDTTRKKRPVVYLMNDEGVVEEEIPIPGVARIDDLEALAEDAAGKIYLACSQSEESGRRPAAERRLLLRLTREGTILRLDGKLSLYDLLGEAAQKDPETAWVRLLAAPKQHGGIKLNVEGIFLSRGDLYLGLKRPLAAGRAVILRIRDIDGVIARQRLERGSVEIWREFSLSVGPTAAPAGISDLALRDDRTVYLLAVPKGDKEEGKQKSSSLWSYDIPADRLRLLGNFDGLKAEGIAFNTDTREWAIVCDQGPQEPSQFLKRGSFP